MKNKLTYIGSSLLMAMAMTGCLADDLAYDGEGTVVLSASVSTDIKVAAKSRAATTQELADSAVIWISSTKGLVRKYEGISSLPSEGIKLTAGTYVAEAWTGDSVPASWEDRYFKGYQPFEVTSGSTSNVDMVCHIANSAVSVNYSDDIDAVIKDYKMTVGHKAGSLTWEGRDSRRGYFMIPSFDKNLHWKLEATTIEGESYVREGVIEDPQPTTEYTINVKCSTVSTEVGGAYLEIVIDESEIEKKDEILITTSPKIQGYNFDINSPVYGSSGTVGRHSVWISTSAAMKNVTVELPENITLSGVDDKSFDFISMSDAFRTSLANAGINATYNYDESNDVATMKINFESALLDALSDGDYSIEVSVTDANGKSSEATLHIVVSAAITRTLEVDENTVWTNKATLEGTVVKEYDGDEVGFNYRKLGESAWTYVKGSIESSSTSARKRVIAEGTKFSAVVTGLQAGTTYQYTTVAGDIASTEIKTVTTDSESQLPNSDFECWTTNSKGAYLATSSESNLFWDSGNHGSITMNKNVTSPDSDVKHGGNYSAKLQSQFVGLGVIGKFAAGNIFVGEYLATDGTDGVLGWGRTWTTRPTALTGYVRYDQANISYKGTSSITSDELDQGIIYVALLDDTNILSSSDASYGYPVVVKTASSQFFDKTASNVIAYGELKFDQTDGFIKFTIPLEYYRTNVKPSYIVLTCSASWQGDTFIGGKSTMWLDDFKLEY
jgi:hypothetical protein